MTLTPKVDNFILLAHEQYYMCPFSKYRVHAIGNGRTDGRPGQ